MGKIEFAGAICILIAAIVPIIQSIPSIQNSLNPQVVQTTYSILLVLGIMIGLILYGIFVFKVGFSLLTVFLRKKIIFEAKIVTEKSKLYLNGYLVFEAKITGWLNAGYVETRIKTEFEEDQVIRLEYNEKKKMGKIKKITSYPLKWKWKIPHDFPDGEHEVSITLRDTEDMLFFWKGDNFRLRVDYTVEITKQPKKNIEIQQITRPTIEAINWIDLNSKKISGWICIKVYNDTDINHSGCYGHAIIRNDKFSLCDYEAFLKNNGTKDIDAYTSFSLEQNSIKRLYVNIETIRKQDKESVIDDVKISIDIGKEYIVKSFPLKFDD